MTFFHELIRAKLALILSALLWSSAFVGIRYGVQVYSPASLALFRYLVASCCMVVIYYCSSCKSQSTCKWIDILLAMLLGVIGFAIYNIFLNYGELHIKASIVAFIIGLSPVIVSVAAVWMYRERLSLRTKWGLVISVVGISVIAFNELKTIPKFKGLMFTFLAMLSLATFSLIKRLIMTKMSPIEFTSYAIWGGTASMLIFLPRLFYDIHHSSLTVTFIIIYLGIFPGAFAYLLSNYGYNKMPVAHAACYSYLIPLFSTVLAFIFLKEEPTFSLFIGETLTFVGAIFVTNSQVKLIDSPQLVKS